jgi:hypothetical protein
MYQETKMSMNVVISIILLVYVSATLGGRDATLLILATSLILYLLWIPQNMPRQGTLDVLVPSPKANATIVDDYSLATVPQDAPYQVPVHDITYVHIQEHPEIEYAFRVIGDLKQRRPSALKAAMASMDRFLFLNTQVLNYKISNVGNSRKHESLKQKVSDMMMLRSCIMEQLNSSAFEFVRPRLNKSIAIIRDYTFQIIKSISTKWRDHVPALQDHGPPYGTCQMSSSPFEMYK